jgi:hypothetical protein
MLLENPLAEGGPIYQYRDSRQQPGKCYNCAEPESGIKRLRHAVTVPPFVVMADHRKSPEDFSSKGAARPPIARQSTKKISNRIRILRLIELAILTGAGSKDEHIIDSAPGLSVII